MQSSKPMGRDDSAAELYKVPELAALGRVFRSTSPIELTESETEYVKEAADYDYDSSEPGANL